MAGPFFLGGYLDGNFWHNLSQKKNQENKTLLPSLKGFDMQKAAGKSAVSSIIASNNSASVMGILLTSYFV